MEKDFRLTWRLFNHPLESRSLRKVNRRASFRVRELNSFFIVFRALHRCAFLTFAREKQGSHTHHQQDEE